MTFLAEKVAVVRPQWLNERPFFFEVQLTNGHNALAPVRQNRNVAILLYFCRAIKNEEINNK